MNYKKIYDQLIQKRRDLPLFKKYRYCETHHIIPKCMKGDNKKENLINLLPEEHFIAHILLVKIYPNEIGLWQTLSIMRGSKKYKTMSNKLYKVLREKLSFSMAKENNPMWNKFGELSPTYGRIPSKEQCENHSKLMKRKYELGELQIPSFKGGKHSEETKEKISKTHKGVPRSKETKEKISRGHVGLMNSPETRLKISNSKKIKVSESIVKEIIRNYSLGKSLRQLSKEFYLGETCLGRILRENDVKLRVAGELFKGKKQKIFICVYCKKEGGEPAMKRWHGENCRSKLS